MQLNTVSQALDFIKKAGRADDCQLNLFIAALAFAKLFHPEKDISVYLEHMDQMIQKLKSYYQDMLADDSDTPLEMKRRALVDIMQDDFLYDGDTQDYNNPDNADIISVIDRRRGLPVALGIIYLHLAREMEWDCYGLNFPGHFLFAIKHDGETVFIDPFRGGRRVQASDMREILKAIAGLSAELSHEYYHPLQDHDIIMRLQNNLKTSLVEREQYAEALKVVEALQVFDPDEYRLLFDAAILKVKTGQMGAAREDVLRYLAAAANPQERSHAEQLLYEIQRSLN